MLQSRNVYVAILLELRKNAVCAFVLPFHIGSQDTGFVDKRPHLGHIITHDCDDSDQSDGILSRKSNFIGQCNKILSNFRNVYLDYASKSKLVKANFTTALRFWT